MVVAALVNTFIVVQMISVALKFLAMVAAQVVVEAPVIFVDAPVLLNPTALIDMVVRLVVAVWGPTWARCPWWLWWPRCPRWSWRSSWSIFCPSRHGDRQQEMVMVMAIDEVVAALGATVTVVQVIFVALKFSVI